MSKSVVSETIGETMGIEATGMVSETEKGTEMRDREDTEVIRPGLFPVSSCECSDTSKGT